LSNPIVRLSAAIEAAEPLLPPAPIEPPTLVDLTQSVRMHFPLIQQALAARSIASGEVLAASGAFDHKLEGYSQAQPLDFYENYQQGLGVKRDTYWGGQVFAGYRVGRGAFEPWYLERATNKGGEFKAGVLVPLARDRGIDANRAELWRAQLERGRVEPEIRAMIIGSVRDATVAYWQWVASAASYRIAEDVLQLGLHRKGYLEKQVEHGEKAEIELVDNQRIILSRSAKVTDARRKLEQAAIKLSLFLRDDYGQPVVLPIDAATADFPEVLAVEFWAEGPDVGLAEVNRPELEELQLVRQQLAILLRQACNETRPQLDAGVLVAQDVGEPTSSKRDKSELELEANLYLSVPLERRKARGKARQLRGKIAQIRAKTRFAAEKITSEVQIAHAGLTAAVERAGQTTEGLTLAKRMQEAEQRLYELGQSTLFNLNLREQQTAEAAVGQVAALYDTQVALAHYAAALGLESVGDLSWNQVDRGADQEMDVPVSQGPGQAS
jgi:outer membrane protein TolC